MKYIQFQKNTPLQYITLPSNLSTATCHEPIHFRNPTPSSDTKPHPTVLYRCCACPSPFSGRSGFPLPPFDCRCVRAECFRCSVSSCSSTKSNVSLSSAFPPPMTYIPNESQTKHCERMCVTKKVLEWLATNQTSGCQPRAANGSSSPPWHKKKINTRFFFLLFSYSSLAHKLTLQFQPLHCHVSVC